MKNKRQFIVYALLGVALATAAALAVSYGARARVSARALEDTYTQHVLETQEHLQSMGIKLDKIPICTDRRTQCDLLTGVSRQADAVVTNLSALPLSHAAMSDTMKFCNQMSEYALGLALSMAGGADLTAGDLEQLSRMRSQCSLLLGQLVTAREIMLRESLRLTGSKDAFYQEAELSDRPLEQVAEKDNGMDYPTLIYDGAFSDARHSGTPKALGDSVIDAARAVEIAVQFVGADRVQNAGEGVPTEGGLASYGVNLTLHDGVQLTAEVTRQGGQLLWMVPEHASFQPGLTLEECETAARAFLRERGYAEMEANHYQIYDGLAVINFVALQGDILLYPDLVKLQIRMDTGEVVGLEANNYLMNHTRREGLSPTLTPEQALSRVSGALTVKSEPRLCVIPFQNREKLCYEVAGTYQNSDYLIYIDAATGEERQVLMIVQTTDSVMSV